MPFDTLDWLDSGWVGGGGVERRGKGCYSNILSLLKKRHLFCPWEGLDFPPEFLISNIKKYSTKLISLDCLRNEANKSKTIMSSF